MRIKDWSSFVCSSDLMLLHGDRELGAAFHRGVVSYYHELAAVHPADAGDEPDGRHLVAIEPARRELRQLEERLPAVEQAAHPLARQQLAAPEVAVAGRFAAALLHALDAGTQIVRQRLVGAPVLGKERIAEIDLEIGRAHV